MNVEPATEGNGITYSKILKEIKIENINRDVNELARKYGYLPYIVQRYIDMIGFEETIELLDTFENYEYRPAILCNILRTKCDILIERLKMLGYSITTINWCSNGFLVTKDIKKPSLGSLHEYLKGFYYVYRDQASLIPPLVLHPKPGSKTLDMCAAPGGKSIHMLILMKDKGLLVANDVSKHRIRSLIANMFRMGFKSYMITLENGIRIPKKIERDFDYVLLDAPCSAEGAIMFDKSRKMKTTQENLAKLVFREIMLLKSAINLTKPGGRIVYTTCSIAPEENEYVITKVIDVMKDKVIIEEANIGIGSDGINWYRGMKFYDDVRKCIRIWPHKHKMEGYFVCILRKNT
ncbi:MAG: RsmB/NOP family class I SAM-dependent RNA methyltransferase [Ignisphaera sp.]|uniref:RsmB/NOP family class I SAM-dependent RNA methyltransferase n=1 Tax=Ignisphaera aggregans TaxID=334771 RepID=A0A7J3MZ90_9CREN